MAAWDDRFNNANIWSYVEQIRQALDAGPDLTDDQQRADRDRVAWLAALIESFRDLDPRLVTPSMIAALEQQLSTVVNAVNQWQAGQGPALLTNAAGPYADNTLNLLHTWPNLGRDRNHKATLAAAREYMDASDHAISDLQELVTAAQQRLADLEAAADTKEQSAQEALASLQTHLAELEAEIDTQTERVTAAVTHAGQEFAAEREKQEVDFEKKVIDLDKRLQTLLEKATADATAAAKDQHDRAKQHLDKLAKLEHQASELVNVISIEGTATGYGQYAEQERKAGWGWAGGAVAVGLAGFVVILWALHGIHATTSWKEITVKIAASLALGGVATYCGTQSRQHREQERQAKRMQLDIAALNPFINNLGKDEQDKIRAAFADRMFGTPAGAAAPGDQSKPVPPTSLIEAAGQLTSIAQVISEAARLNGGAPPGSR